LNEQYRRCYACIASSNGFTPRIFITRFMLYANTCKLISLLTLIQCSCLKVRIAHPGLECAKGVFYRRTACTHSFRFALQSFLRCFENLFIFPATDSSNNSSRLSGNKVDWLRDSPSTNPLIGTSKVRKSDYTLKRVFTQPGPTADSQPTT
jgi:hypothetical protein